MTYPSNEEHQRIIDQAIFSASARSSEELQFAIDEAIPDNLFDLDKIRTMGASLDDSVFSSDRNNRSFTTPGFFERLREATSDLKDEIPEEDRVWFSETLADAKEWLEDPWCWVTFFLAMDVAKAVTDHYEIKGWRRVGVYLLTHEFQTVVLHPRRYRRGLNLQIARFRQQWAS